MRKVITATGKELECSYITQIDDPPRIYIRIRNASVGEVTAIFSDPKETAVIKCGDMHISRFTRLVSVSPEAGLVRVTLGKE